MVSQFLFESIRGGEEGKGRRGERGGRGGFCVTLCNMHVHALIGRKDFVYSIYRIRRQKIGRFWRSAKMEILPIRSIPPPPPPPNLSAIDGRRELLSAEVHRKLRFRKWIQYDKASFSFSFSDEGKLKGEGRDRIYFSIYTKLSVVCSRMTSK